jgi:hypothetical protein
LSSELWHSLDGFQRFGSPYCLSFQGRWNQQKLTLAVTYAFILPWPWRPQPEWTHGLITWKFKVSWPGWCWLLSGRDFRNYDERCLNTGGNSYALRWQSFDCVNWRHNRELLHSVHMFRVQN